MTTRNAHQHCGYTLSELLNVLGVIAVLGGLATPVANLVARTQATSIVNTLITHLNVARAAALDAGERVLLCKNGGGTDCSVGALWHDGWIVFVDQNHNEHVDPAERVVLTQPAWSGGELALHAFGGMTRYVAYESDGASTNGTFTYCPRYGDATRQIILSKTGRARAVQVAPAAVAGVCGAP